MSRVWLLLLLAAVTTGGLLWVLQAPSGALSAADLSSSEVSPIPHGGAVTPKAPVGTPVMEVEPSAAPPESLEEERVLQFMARSTAWSQLRRALLAAPEGVSASQISAIEGLLRDLRAQRRGAFTASLRGEQRALYQGIIDSPLASRPSVAAALRSVEAKLPPPPSPTLHQPN